MAGYAILADAIVVLGGLLRWAWVRNLPFRIVHLAAVVLVAAEALAGAACPLTLWEYRLRLLAGQRVEGRISFVARLVRSLIFYDLPAWVFVAVYVAFAAAVALTFILVRPARRPSAPRSRPPAPPRPL